jgi:uncharacterized protein involved in exopolysaccharide biosynthesis
LALALTVPALAAVLVFVVGLLWVLRQPSVYTAQTTVIFSAKVGSSGAIPGSDTVVLTANNALGVIGAPLTVAQVAADSGLSPGELSGGTMATVPADTATVEIAVTGQDREQAAVAANAYAKALLGYMKPNKLVIAQQVGEAIPPEGPSGPARTVLTVIVAALAALAGLLLLSLFVWFDRLRERGGVRGLVAGWMRLNDPELGDEKP